MRHKSFTTDIISDVFKSDLEKKLHKDDFWEKVKEGWRNEPDILGESMKKWAHDMGDHYYERSHKYCRPERTMYVSHEYPSACLECGHATKEWSQHEQA